MTLLAAGLAAQIAAALVPNIILPALDIPTLAALSLLALVLEVILFGENHRFWATSLIVGTVAFGVLSLCAGSVPDGAGRAAGRDPGRRCVPDL